MQHLPQIEQPDMQHIAHIHECGTCVENRAHNEAPVEYPLNTVATQQGWTGLSTTTLSGVTVDTLFSGAPKYLNRGGNQRNSSWYILCGPRRPAGGSTSGGSFTSGSSSY
jgi:hypothetical protein